MTASLDWAPDVADIAGFARHRRLRATAALRDVMREAHLNAAGLVAPVFVTDDALLAGAIERFPGIRRHALDAVVDAVGDLVRAGVRAVMLFGVPRVRDARAAAAWDPAGVVPEAIRRVRRAHPDLAVAADVCLCQYTPSGGCELAVAAQRVVGVAPGASLGDASLSDASLDAIARAAVAYAEAGADIVAPSGMLDGGVLAIRRALDATGLQRVAILAYSVKHASSLYAPFRSAVASTPAPGARLSHQLDAANAREAMREAASDLAEGADILMVKPALTNLDTLVRLRAAHPNVPLAAFEVSGEYAMLEAAAERGWLDRRGVALEQLTALQRAGAGLVVTYRAGDLARWIREG